MILHSEWHREPLAEPLPQLCDVRGDRCCGTPACLNAGQWSSEPICDDCNRPVTDDDAGPSCGSHALHSWCSTRCSGCVDEQRQVDEDARADREWGEGL